MTKMSRKHTLKEVGSGYRRGRWIDKQYPKEFQRVAPLVQETQYILPWKQVGTLSFPLKAWNSVGCTDLLLKSQKECEFFASVSNIFQLLQQHLGKILILLKDETKFCNKFFFQVSSQLVDDDFVCCGCRYWGWGFTCPHLFVHLCPPIFTFFIIIAFLYNLKTRAQKRQGKTKRGLKSYFCTLSLFLGSFGR